MKSARFTNTDGRTELTCTDKVYQTAEDCLSGVQGKMTHGFRDVEEAFMAVVKVYARAKVTKKYTYRAVVWSCDEGYGRSSRYGKTVTKCTAIIENGKVVSFDFERVGLHPGEVASDCLWTSGAETRKHCLYKFLRTEYPMTTCEGKASFDMLVENQMRDFRLYG